jgi:RNA polymerase sigma factor (sigma-70 family)
MYYRETEMDDRRLLKQFLESRSQAAFSHIVERHHKLVYSTCWRELQSAQLAEDATQIVFLVLAEKASSLRNEVILAGWLFRTARFTAMAVRKSEMRRRIREQKIGSEIMTIVQQDEEAWKTIEPWLDESLAHLAEADRVAVLLRFFEEMSFAEIGVLTGQKEDAARHRVGRALDKMHRFLVKKGVVVTQTVFIGLLVANALRPASAIQVPVINPNALSLAAPGHAAAQLTGSHVGQLTKGVLKTMLIKQAATVAAITVIGTGTLVGAGLAVTHRTDGIRPPAARAAFAVTGAAAPAPAQLAGGNLIRLASDEAAPAAPTAAAPSPGIVGLWEGAISDPTGVSLRIVLKITTDASGGIKGAIHSPDQDVSNHYTPLDRTAFNQGVLTFAVNNSEIRDASFSGNMASDGLTISGTFNQLSRTHPLILKKETQPSANGPMLTDAEAAPILGNWAGRLGPAGAPGSLRINVRVYRDATGAVTADLQSPDQMQPWLPTILSFQNNAVGLKVNSVGGAYSGTVSSDDRSVSGNWTQLGQVIPLTLTKQ